MKARFRDSMIWLHTWSGLVVGWLLFAIFLTGTVSFFQDEISAWMQPELNRQNSPHKAIGDAQRYLNEHGPDSSRWSITLPNPRAAVTTLFWRDPEAGGRGFRRAHLDGAGEEATIRDTRGGGFLYRFHFDLHYIPVFWARWIVGICAMFMLVAIISGIIIHKKIFKDFFTFRPKKGAKSWLDAHTLTSVLALPFHLMITYTGLVTLMFMYLSWSVSLGFSDSKPLFDSVFQQFDIPDPSAQEAPMMSLEELYLAAQAQMENAPISFVTVHNPGDENAVVQFSQAPTKRLLSRYATLTYSAVTGELLDHQTVNQTADLTRRTMINLHAGRFADLHLRWLYFLSGMAGTLMIASGLVLWSKKRSVRVQKRARVPLGHKLVARLNVGCLLGLPFAIATFFAANRLLPLNLADRADMEIHCFFGGWLFMLLYPLFRGVQRTWREGALVVGVAYLLLPILSIFTVQQHLFSDNYFSDKTLFSIDCALFLTGILFLALAWHQGRSHSSYVRTTRREFPPISGPIHDRS